MTTDTHDSSGAPGSGWKGGLKTALFASGLSLALLAAPANAQLDRALQEAKSATAAAAAAQAQIDSLDDRADAASRDYAATLQQSDNLRLFVDRQEIYLESQRSDLENLQRQILTVENVKQGVVPLMLEMVVKLEDSVRADIPFREAERLARIQEVKDVVTNPRILPADQYRRILNAYAIETNYGYQTEAYEGAHPSKPGNVVDFLRAGRTSWAYVSKDESEVAVYDLADRAWKPVSGADAIELRQAIRIGSGEAGEDIIYMPMVKR